MPELAFAKDRSFPTIDLAVDPVVLVVPDEMATAASVRHLQQVLAGWGQTPDIVAQKDFGEHLFQEAHIIAAGHMADNAALQRLYLARCCFVDTFFPGPGGHFIKSISDPFGQGRNCIVVGASSTRDLDRVFPIFADLVRRGQGVLNRVHAHSFAHSLPPLPDESDLEEMVRAELATWSGGWAASPFREGRLKDYLWHFYLSDHPGWGRAIPPIFAGSMAPWRAERQERPDAYHCFFNLHSFIHLWDLVEDSPLYTAADRRDVVTLFGELLRHQAGLFYLREEVNPPDEIRQNHSTFIGLNLAVGHDYMVRRYNSREFAPAEEAAARIFAGQAHCYKPNDDAGVGYAWHVPQETLFYLLYRNDYRYIDEGHVAALCQLAALTTDNMRSEAGYGDTSGYAAFSPKSWDARLWPLMVSTWRTRDPAHLWLLNWLGQGKKPSLSHVLSGLYAAVEFRSEEFLLEGCQPREPVELLGVCPLELPAPALRWVQNHAPAPHRPDPRKTYFDKLSLRPGFAPRDEYLLLEGTGTFCHGHEDSNAILRLTWNERAWLADGDYIRAAPKFHNSITVCRDGVGVLSPPGEGLVAPPLAALNRLSEGPDWGLVQTEVAGYNGMDWQRNIYWRKGRFFAIVDQLHCTAAGEYTCHCLWRLVGETERQGPHTRLHQQGESLYLRSADGSEQELVPDLHEPGYWTGYPYADPVPQVLHQKSTRTLQPGDDLVYANLLTPHEEIELEQLGDCLFRVVDRGETSILGLGHTRLGEVEIESTLFVLSAVGEALYIQGVEHLVDAEGNREPFNNEFHCLNPPSNPLARRLHQAIKSAPASLPPQARPLPPPGKNDRQPVWTFQFPDAEISDMAGCGDLLVAGTKDGEVVQLSAAEGRVQWRRRVNAPVSALRLADLDGDDIPAVLVGTEDADLVVLDGRDGTERWRRQLQGMGGRGAPVTAIAAADLEGAGQPSVLAGTAGWYVHAFDAVGCRQWASWIRYHVITALEVADVDGDGRAEVMVGNVYSTPLTVHNFDGSFRWSTFEEVGSEGNGTTPRRGICLTCLTLCDVDGDGVVEIVYGTADGWIHAVKPQDGASVWHTNIVGQVIGLAPTASGLVAASEYGDLYGFSFQGQIRWRIRASAWIRGLAVLKDHIAIAAEKGRLLLYNLRGESRETISMDGEIQSLRTCGEGVVCRLEGGRLSRVEVAD